MSPASEFERDVIDRLARLETGAENRHEALLRGLDSLVHKTNGHDSELRLHSLKLQKLSEEVRLHRRVAGYIATIFGGAAGALYHRLFG